MPVVPLDSLGGYHGLAPHAGTRLHKQLRQRERESLCDWYDWFSKVASEMEELTQHEKLVTFQRGWLKDDDFLYSLTVDLPSNFMDVVVRTQRDMAVEEVC